MDKKAVSFEVYEENNDAYKIEFDTDKITKNSKVELYFKNKYIVSALNSLLNTSNLTVNLRLTDSLKSEIELKKQSKQSKEAAKSGAKAGVSIAVGLSFMNFDPTSFFDFMNTAEMFYSVYLYNLELNPIISNFLIGLRLQNDIPKFFTIFID